MTEQSTALDTEITTYNKGHPFDPRNLLVSYSYTDGVNPPNHSRFDSPEFNHSILRRILETRVLIGFNIKFDLHWLTNLFRCSTLLFHKIKIWDCQLAESVISGQTNAFASLNETLESYSLPTKPDIVASYWEAGIQTTEIPSDILEEYNNYDVTCLHTLQKIQMSLMTPSQIQLVWDMGDDLKTLQHAEHAGIKFDRAAANTLVAEKTETIKGIDQKLNTYLPDSFHSTDLEFNYNSGHQLSALIYGGTITYSVCTSTDAVYQSGPKKGTAYVRNSWSEVPIIFDSLCTPLADTEIASTRKNTKEESHFFKTDAETLQALRPRTKAARELILLLLERAKEVKVLEMVDGVFKLFEEKQWVDDLIHAQFNQTVARTGRLSSSSPNMQNTPAEIDKLLISRYA